MPHLNWDLPYRSTRTPVFARQVVSTSHPLAAQAGLAVLRQGGNAVDAAIAAAAVMTVVEPCSNGLGSDLFALVWDGEGLHGLNASGTAPQAWTPDYFHQRHAQAVKPPQRGWDSVTVPGMVAGWQALHQRFGSQAWADVLAPAAEVAEQGFAVTPVVQHKWAAAACLPDLVRQPGFQEVFLPQGRAPDVGERFCLPGAASAFQLLAREGAEAFYQGAIAHDLVAQAREGGAALTAQDLAAYEVEWVTPLAQAYRGYTVHEIPPNGQGIAALMALGMVQHFDLQEWGADSAQAQHVQIEAMKLAFADLHRHVAAPQAMRVSVDQLLDPAYLRSRAQQIDLLRAQDFGPGLMPEGGTIYLTAADAQGRMVSLIQSNYMGFGSGVVVPSWGLSLQNRGHGFSLQPGSPNVVAPGKRPFHTIIPGFLSQEGRPVMSFGVMGADMQPQGHLQTLVRLLDFSQNVQAACDAPRWRVHDGQVSLERGWAAEFAQGLADRGHRLGAFADSYQDFGAGQFIWRLDEGRGAAAERGYVAASDPRRDGLAAGW